MEPQIEQLYEGFRLEIRALYKENKKVSGALSETQMKSYSSLVLSIPDIENDSSMSLDHKS